MSSRLCVLGSLNMDLVVTTPRFPLPGETVLGGSFHRSPGGKGANQAVAAARLGAEVAMIGCLGRDDHGAELRRVLATEGIDHQAVSESASPTGVALIQVQTSGENQIVVAPGANADLSPARLENHHSALQQADLLLMQMEVPAATVWRAAELACDAGTLVVLNAAPAQSLPAEAPDLLDALLVNQAEAATLSDLPLETPPEDLLRALLAQGFAEVILTAGKAGAWAGRKSESGLQILFQKAFPVVAVDSVGAGDAFAGAWSMARAEGRSQQECLQRGAVAGALATTARGAIPAMPSRAAWKDAKFP
ncbi:MAG: ribokinase [Planctomycetota bacterium]|nr:MAG: ribokinase [Planctomycetota bacterium]